MEEIIALPNPLFYKHTAAFQGKTYIHRTACPLPPCHVVVRTLELRTLRLAYQIKLSSAADSGPIAPL
jgi:hypothetical protein